MNKEIKQKWVNALRSGEYKQGQEYLRNKRNEFCCLGVLCDIYKKETNKTEWISSGENYTINNEYGLLPDEVIEWAELDCPNSINPHVILELEGNTQDVSLATINDTFKLPFNEVANLIENQL